jgi:signal transduction histidine kinase
VLLLFLAFVLLVGFAGWLSYHILGQGGEPDWQRGEGPPPIGPFIGLIVIIAIIVFVMRRIQATVRPVVQVMEATSRVAQGDYGVRIEPTGPRDVQRIMLAFNEMTSQLEANERERRRLFADIAHELRTPLAVIQGNIEGMMDGVYPRDDAHMAPLLEQTKVITRLLGDLQTMASTETGSLHLYIEDTDLCAVINDVIAAFAPAATREGVGLVAEHPEEPLPSLEIDPVRIRQVLENLVSNAVRYTPGGGSVRITTARVNDGVRVTVADTGRGMTQEDANRMFERFVKSADSGGSGLGLAIAKGLVEAHGGTISATSTPGEGTIVTFTLPV